MTTTLTIKKIKILAGIAACMMFLLVACKQNTKVVPKQEQHWAEVKATGMGMMYIDKIPNSTIMQEAEQGKARTIFCSYRVGFVDSIPAKAPEKKDLEKGKYYQYRMPQDWTVLIDGDSVKPVFYQPMIKKQAQQEEGVLVFEIPKDREIDTLIYNDSYGPWGKQVIINSKY